MKEENKIRTIGFTAFFMSVVAFFLYCALVSCCTPIKLNERFSTKEYKEAKQVAATLIFIDSTARGDHWISILYWEDNNKTKWYTESTWPCPFKVGFVMPLLTKR